MEMSLRYLCASQQVWSVQQMVKPTALGVWARKTYCGDIWHQKRHSVHFPWTKRMKLSQSPNLLLENYTTKPFYSNPFIIITIIITIIKEDSVLSTTQYLKNMFFGNALKKFKFQNSFKRFGSIMVSPLSKKKRKKEETLVLSKVILKYTKYF